MRVVRNGHDRGEEAMAASATYAPPRQPIWHGNRERIWSGTQTPQVITMSAGTLMFEPFNMAVSFLPVYLFAALARSESVVSQHVYCVVEKGSTARIKAAWLGQRARAANAPPCTWHAMLARKARASQTSEVHPAHGTREEEAVAGHFS